LFGIIGIFVLLLACINFMNLSTARSEKRAKEVGIRKAIGSLRSQLIRQFFSESLLVAMFAFILSLLLVQAILPYFNEVADKKISILWANPLFWISGIAFILITGCIAGSYPALYLSSFQPVKVLKGTFRAGRFANIPRKVLVVLQFTVSVILIIGTVVVFRQVEFAKDRSVGYDRNRLLMVPMITNDIHDHFGVVRNELKNSGAVTEIAESSAATTYIGEVDNGFEWAGKSASLQGNFGVTFVTPEFGKTIDWTLNEGRDFSRDFATDSSAVILNETAAKFMGFQHPIGETIKWDGRPYQVIGVVKDMVLESPYEPVFRSVFVLDKGAQNIINVKINPAVTTHKALSAIEAVFKKYNPSQQFEYKFIDENMPGNLGMKNVLANWQVSLPRWLFLSVASAFLEWLLLWQSSAQRRSVCEKYWVRRYLIYGVYFQKNLLCSSLFLYLSRFPSLIISCIIGYRTINIGQKFHGGFLQ